MIKWTWYETTPWYLRILGAPLWRRKDGMGWLYREEADFR